MSQHASRAEKTRRRLLRKEKKVRDTRAKLIRAASGESAHDDYFKFCDLLRIHPTHFLSPDDGADKIRQMFMVSGALQDLPASSVVVPELAPDGALIVPSQWLLDQMINAEALPGKVFITQPISLCVDLDICLAADAAIAFDVLLVVDVWLFLKRYLPASEVISPQNKVHFLLHALPATIRTAMESAIFGGRDDDLELRNIAKERYFSRFPCPEVEEWVFSDESILGDIEFGYVS